MIVVDASVIVELVLATPTGARLESRLASLGQPLNAPHLLSVEVVHVLRRFLRAGSVTADSAEAAVEELEQLPITRWAHEPLLARMWDLRANMTAYDATYVVLAEALGGTLITTDERLRRAAADFAEVDFLPTVS
ncbi:MAG: type II toxin-antitoxin system VapC family toxin [Sporichthyaceae bacterium]|nr:type II toxin-antitoxin system VapC family toxin [Sporichthyaceae bacterium]